MLRNANDIGALIRSARQAKGMSQAALAQRAGVRQTWISQVENGKPTAALGLVLQTLNALGVILQGRTAEQMGQAGLGAGSDDVDLDALIDSYRMPRREEHA
ncbi:helix-turn-helix domain-containing protein [Ferrovibrio sp.]|uniref:helix-turn-helix domain-containing protein n=1 Tax=Ferrovibrio sp. TaxID=1917215 RepID=UPI0025B7D4D1|nr:helix-turn-helix domain-containing protein [Ferrovibrio sp.]MBX3456509.1 helix-turn-helix transcriptional regulator [Ferrovibrio sp.]